MGFIILGHLRPLHHSELCQLYLLKSEQPGTAWAENHSPPGGVSGSLPVQESGKVSHLPFRSGFVVGAAKSVCLFLLRFPQGRQFSPHTATLAFAEGSSPTTSLQDVLRETTFQQVPCHVPQPPNVPCISPCPWGCHLLQPPRAEGNAVPFLLPPHCPWAVPSAARPDLSMCVALCYCLG